MQLASMLKIERGVTALIGAGGKTTLLLALARELQRQGTVIVCTTTHILLPPMPVYSSLPETAERCICIGTPAENGKLTAPQMPMEQLARAADFVLVEADGAHGLPVKAHAEYEPVIPAEANQTILVLGLSGIGRPVREVVHRQEIFCELTGVSADALLSPALAAALLERERLHTRVFLNQADDAERQQQGRDLAKELSCPVCMGALERGTAICLY